MTGKTIKVDDKRKTRKLPPHLWKKGQSGNPSGKPRGCGRLSWFNEHIKDKRAEIIDKVVAEALKGQEVAMQLVISRMIPQFAQNDEEVHLEGFKEAKTRIEKANLVANSIAEGIITPNQGAVLMGVIEKNAKISEIDDLLPRLEALESLLKAKE